MSAVTRAIVPAVCIAVTVAGLMNTYGDATEVRKLAERTACGKEHCSVTILEEQRTPFSHQYVFQTSVQGQTKAAVECAREFVLVGAYSCKTQ